jgi:predicted permease
MADELGFHLAARAADLVKDGVPPADAARQARLEFGNPAAWQEHCRDARGLRLPDAVRTDLRLAFRMAARRPWSTAAAVLILGLGISANTTILSFVDAVLFARPPVEEPAALAWITAAEPDGRPHAIADAEYREVFESANSFAGVFALRGARVSLEDPPARLLFTHAVSANYFDLLGVHAALGRTFLPRDDRPGAPGVIVLSHDLWVRRFASDPGVVGRTMMANRRPFAIIGVAAQGFRGLVLGENVPAWVPLAAVAPAVTQARGTRTSSEEGSLALGGRLAAGVTHPQAAAQLSSVTGLRAVVSPMAGSLSPAERAEGGWMVALFPAVSGLVLLVACANVGNLRLARAWSRRRDTAMRHALGASRGRLIAQFVAESVPIAVLGTAAGLLMSWSLAAGIVQAGGLPASLASVFRPDGRIAAVSVVVALLALVLYGLVPAIAGSTLTPASAGSRSRVQAAFVMTQVAASVILLALSGLVLRSMQRALLVDPGFDTGALLLGVDASSLGLPPAARDAFERRALETVRGTHGVSAAALTSAPPLVNGSVEQDVFAAFSGPVAANIASVSDRFFETLRIAVRKGRPFSAEDTGSDSPVAIVSEMLAKRLWPDGDALGRQIHLGAADEPAIEVVGVAADVQYRSLAEVPPPICYLPRRQTPVTSGAWIVARLDGDPGRLTPDVIAAMRRIDPSLPGAIVWMKTLVAHSVEKRRSLASIVGLFGALALLVGGLGIGAVTAQSVTLKTREIGIRMALGATGRSVSGLFVREAVILALGGIAVGLGVSAIAGRALAAYLVAPPPIDLPAFAVTALTVAGVAALASYLPARRTSRISPVVALKDE